MTIAVAVASFVAGAALMYALTHYHEIVIAVLDWFADEHEIITLDDL